MAIKDIEKYESNSAIKNIPAIKNIKKLPTHSYGCNGQYHAVLKPVSQMLMDSDDQKSMEDSLNSLYQPVV